MTHILKDFLSVTGNTISIEIVEILMNSPEHSIQELSEHISISSSTIVRHIKSLSYSGIIEVSRISNKKVFYRLNRKYFLSLKNALSDYFDILESC